MTSRDLAQSYIWKAETRLAILEVLNKKRNFSDVIREAQEVVELALKGMLRAVGVEPPKLHDVGGLLLEHRDRFKAIVAKGLKRAANISKQLRKERELAFYGDIDFNPTEEYTAKDARQAIKDAIWVVGLAKKVTLTSSPR